MVIDVHSHIYPRSYLDRLRTAQRPPRVVERSGQEYLDIFPAAPGSTDAPPRPLSNAFWSLDAKVAFMDEWRIAHAVLSVGNPWVDWMPSGEAIEWASQLN